MPSVEQKTQSVHRSIIFFTILLLILFVLFSPIFPALYHEWFYYNDNSHGILVPFISLYLIWLNRHAISLKDVQTSYLGLGILVLGLTSYVLGYAGRIEVISRVAFVTAILGLVFYNFGRKIFFGLAFPFFFLFFMIPVPVAIENIVSFRLQLWVTQISSAVLSALSISVLREGNILHFANCSLEVAEACSGIRSLTAYIMLGCLFGYMMQGSFIRKSVMVLIAVPLAFFMNLTRVVGTGLLANYFGPKVALGFLHEFSGIVIFIAGFVIYFIIFNVLSKAHQPKSL
jgi:exosortase